MLEHGLRPAKNGPLLMCMPFLSITSDRRQPFRLEAMQVTIDSRERGLINIFQRAGVAHRVETLPVGDLLCQYADGCRAWVAERKRSDDLAASVKDGRWREQSVRLFGCGCQVVYVFEGDFRETGGMYPNLLGLWINSELRPSYTFRTLDLQETALVLHGLITKLEHTASYAAPANGLAPPNLSKRKRNEDADTVFLRVLMCVPSISEPIARKLADQFGSLPKLQAALRSTEKFPRIKLTEKTVLGKARLAKLARHLV